MNAILAQPIDSTLKVHRLPDDNGADPKLSDKPTAIPARCQRRDHDCVAIAALAPGLTKCVGFAVDRGVVFLHTTIVPAAEKRAIPVEQRRADRYSTLRQTYPSFLDRYRKHRFVIHVEDSSREFVDMLTSNQMVHDFQPGDFLIFQLEAGYGLLRVLGVDAGDGIWHLAAYRDFFLDPEMADAAIGRSSELQVEIPHVALTNRAFESTQVSRMENKELSKAELAPYELWRSSSDREVSDRSIRLLLGLR